VNLYIASLIALGATAGAVGIMLLVRRRAPDGGFFNDGDRAAGVFGVLATSFSVLLAFVVFLAFTSYDKAKSGADQEAMDVVQQFQTAQAMPRAVAPLLGGELVCYGRNVVRQEWPRMSSGKLGDDINPWSVAMFRTLKTVEPRTASEQTAYGKWFDQVSDRESARSDRTHGAEGVIPTPLWVVLLLSAVVVFIFMIFFADPSEGRVVQGTMVASVAIVITSTLLLLWFLNNPYQSSVGGLKPVAMERTLLVIDRASAAAAVRFPIPCDENGVPTGG
jgi:hypothetical protein